MNEGVVWRRKTVQKKATKTTPRVAMRAKYVKWECTAETPTVVLASHSVSSVATATPPPPPPGIPYNSVAAGRVQPTAAATPPQNANVNSGKATFPIPSVARQPSTQATSSPVTSTTATPASVSNEEKKTAPATPSSEVPPTVAPVVSTEKPAPVVVDSYANSTRTVAEIVAGEKAASSVLNSESQSPQLTPPTVKEQPQQVQQATETATAVAPQQKEVLVDVVMMCISMLCCEFGSNWENLEQ